jgi:lipoate---protein ligase
MVSEIVRKYDLPDSYLFENDIVKSSSIVWIPNETCIVMGRSNNSVDSLFTEDVVADNIPVYKRPSGGEAVVLSNKMVVLSIAVEQTDFKSGKSYFKDYNTKIISVLKNLGIEDLGYKGISDITINDLKILGSSIYQNKFIVFYHAVLNVGESVSLIDKYLKHPVREPDYRKNRNHKDFITSLFKENYNIIIDDIKKAIEIEFQKFVDFDID